mgnify:CR=1 FL=1
MCIRDRYHYETKGTCSRAIDIDLDEATGTIRSVRFTGGCNGNTKGLNALVEGQKATDVIARLQGIRCGMRPTSCPDQLAEALTEALEQL